MASFALAGYVAQRIVMPSTQANLADKNPVYAEFASNRANLSLSEERLRRYQPEAFGLRGFLWSIRKRTRVKWLLGECLKYGDARAAIVGSLQPLVVAAFSDEFDSILALRFPDAMVEHFSLAVGQRLIAVNAYGRHGQSPARDIVQGPNARTLWGNFVPTIAEFFSDDLGRIKRLHSTISEPEWNRCLDLWNAWLATRTPPERNGLPLYADTSAL